MASIARSVAASSSSVRAMTTAVHAQPYAQFAPPPIAAFPYTPPRPDTLTTRITNPGAKTMPRGFSATVAQLETFQLPDKVTGSRGDRALGRAIVSAWCRDGIIQFSMDARPWPCRAARVPARPC